MRALRATVLGFLAAALISCGAAERWAPATSPAQIRSESVVRSAPLIAGEGGHLVVLEYEAWFGPDAVTFQNAEAMPVLQSPDMQRVGGGYDSLDPHVIAQHVMWMEYMGVDAVTIDLTNNVGCIFSTGPVSRTFCDPATEQFREQNRNIRKRVGNLYPAWSNLGTRLKVIPLLGCQTWMDLRKDSDGSSGFQKEIEYFAGLIARYPQLSVEYLGRPLLLVYVGTPVNPNMLNALNAVLRTTRLEQRFTFRIVGGYLDSQPSFWNNPEQTPNGPIEIAPRYRFWSVVDRYKPRYALYPTYSLAPGRQRQAENLTVSLATAAQNGWGCPRPTYCGQDALRYGEHQPQYVTLDRFMALAVELNPRFLIVNQFNEFAQPDEGWNAQTSDDAEPTLLPTGWGYGAIQAIREEIAAYRAQIEVSAGLP
jgi:hypothetical protein